MTDPHDHDPDLSDHDPDLSDHDPDLSDHDPPIYAITIDRNPHSGPSSGLTSGSQRDFEDEPERFIIDPNRLMMCPSRRACLQGVEHAGDLPRRMSVGI